MTTYYFSPHHPVDTFPFLGPQLLKQIVYKTFLSRTIYSFICKAEQLTTLMVAETITFLSLMLLQGLLQCKSSRTGEDYFLKVDGHLSEMALK